MGEYSANPLAVSIFGIVTAVNTVLFIGLEIYIKRHLIKPELADTLDPHFVRKSFVGPLSYLVGVAAAWFSMHAAFLVYMLTPLFFITPPRPRRSAAGPK